MRELTLPPHFPLPGMITEVAGGDRMYDGSDERYAAVGESALRIIEAALRGAPVPRRILDLPSGYGRITRVLRARFPDAAITVCDIDAAGVGFCAARFGARGICSVDDFRLLDLEGTYDLIWVGSLITHLPEQQTRRFLDCMVRHMSQASTLVISSHGDLIAQRMRSGVSYGLRFRTITALLEEYGRTGYGYSDYPGRQEYGISVISRQWFEKVLDGSPLQLNEFCAAAWDNHQDVLVLRLAREHNAVIQSSRMEGFMHRIRPLWRALFLVPLRLRKSAAQSDHASTLGTRPSNAQEPIKPGNGFHGNIAEIGWFEGQSTQQRLSAADQYEAQATSSGVRGFDEAWYTSFYQDVGAAVARGEIASGRQHYIEYGRHEGRLPSAGYNGAEDEELDEAWYVSFYRDVEAAIAKGEIASGLEHYVRYGREEGRWPSAECHERTRFDEGWYAASYPMARMDVEMGTADDYAQHYKKLGRARGYLPNRYAPRPPDPTTSKSRFVGLWPDQGNALDLIAGRRELGVITERQAEQLTHWISQGYVVLKGALSSDLLDRAEEEIDRAYRGEISELLFECPELALGEIPFDDRIPQHPAKALDLHWLSPIIRELIFAPDLRCFLELLFERPVLATQSLSFLRGSAQAHHLDTLYVAYSLPMQFAASWIALEDVAAGAGELSYYAGSHKLPEHLFLDEYKSIRELMRMQRDSSLQQMVWRYEASLPELARAHEMSQQTFVAKRGDILVWHAGLVHGGMPISQERTRKSVVTHYCPREVAPLSWESSSPSVHTQNGQAYYTTSYYSALPHS
jgi:SAM-dependent methyltransferase/ectoine hydroxylase-related dioxygenase (phytanoyl-CoA dioxygenase family)